MEDDDRPTEAMDAVFTDPEVGGDTVFDTRLGPGTEVGGYIIDDELGRGAFGVVYAATHPLIGKRAAIKVLKPEVSNNAGVVERFVLEARAVNEIGHPNIVDIFAYGTLPDGRQYLVMDLLVGETLAARIARSTLALAEAVTVIDQIASALAAAHAKGIVHRDLKPDNVFLVAVPGSTTPEVKLLDFGIVKLLAANEEAPEVHTKTGIFLGTANYMSPEQARGRVDHRTDIYALGVMTFELLTGRLPYIHDNAMEVMVAHELDPIPSVLALAPGTPIELAQLTEAMMAKTADDRPTLAAIRTVLRRMKTMYAPMVSLAGVPMRTLPGIPPPASAPAESRHALPASGLDDALLRTKARTDPDLVINPSAPKFAHQGSPHVRPGSDPAGSAPAVRASRLPTAPRRGSLRWLVVLLVLAVVGAAAAAAAFLWLDS